LDRGYAAESQVIGDVLDTLRRTGVTPTGTTRAAHAIELVRAERELGRGGRADPEPLAEIASQHPTWRYAHRIAAATDGTAQRTLAFVERFGNDAWLWRHTTDEPSLPGRLACEALFLPHDVEAWTALIARLDAEDANAELRARLSAQATLSD